MANGGMWPMRQSDRGGLLVSAIKDAPEGAAALERAKAKIASAAPGTFVELDKDELDAVVGEPDTAAEARPSALERAIAKHRACKPGQVLEMDAEEWAAFFPWVNKTDESAAKNGARAADARVRERILEKLTESQPKPASRSALATAADVVDHRRAAYGSPKENFQRIADFWSISMRDKLKPGETVSLADVAQMMRLVKEARLIETPDHFDSLVDICGYVDCQQQVLP